MNMCLISTLNPEQPELQKFLVANVEPKFSWCWREPWFEFRSWGFLCSLASVSCFCLHWNVLLIFMQFLPSSASHSAGLTPKKKSKCSEKLLAQKKTVLAILDQPAWESHIVRGNRRDDSKQDCSEPSAWNCHLTTCPGRKTKERCLSSPLFVTQSGNRVA